MAGMLYLVPTPIGNLGDISPRCRETLEAADFIAAEDTRVSLKLLNHLGIRKSLISYHQHNQNQKGQGIVDRILAGETCALVSDAGSPAISDPGEELVKQCAQAGITVCAIPGPCALVTALSISGQSTGRFCFEGFPSTAKKSRMEHLESLKRETRTMIFYEAPHKLLSTLEDMEKVFGPQRPISLCRELTKLHEEVIRTTLSGALALYAQQSPKGEFVLVVAGAEPEEKPQATAEEAAAQVARLMEQGLSRKDAVKQTAEALGLPKNLVYDAALNL
ncbi:MAG TPA: 16S rRNA (cytidine(1402)-2'-O)-methyltransferase [Candidatus Faecousia excrementigallinarum]|uniref:Ribosomal RNA small subunit methyltransferase I n=1 Tax=Candidatus Faecousia excrementigallinarum TaxID=2840806 RepID=A0A9D0Z296_9FIRM|nr:16S rRNA (cytidine(1402)-2'-O)-methyltransferase [Candidatus Faecousia excrementigallinarum]